jgi:hypothetical protein
VTSEVRVLKYIDVFIGVSLVMLGVSLIITVVTQVVSFAANFRGTQLRNGLAELFSTLSSEISKEEAQQIAHKLLHHQLIADGLGKASLAPAISRADLVNLLSTRDLVVGALGEATADKVSAILGDVEKWFDATMSRVANRFTMQTRIVTIIAASIMAFGIQLDAFGLVKQLCADSDLRASLVGATSTMLGDAQQVLSPPTVYRDAAATLAGDPKNGLPAPPASLASRDEAENWIRGNAGNDPANVGTLVKAFEDLLGKSLQEKIPALVDKAIAIKLDLERADTFGLIPNHPPWDYGSLWVFLGVLTSAMLLSLGAPFWFNMLKTASNLRPAIAAYVEDREPTDAPAADQKPAAQAPVVPAAPASAGAPG